ncbi:nitroreductase family protein [Candidatus Bipolaricaulota bacterium]|nr:nitroreductase family protein [Candidatus Bipolaricaulota bacterium]
MSFFDITKKRSSIRAFKEREISEGEEEKLLKAANSAPSAGNLQSYEIVAIKNKELKDELVGAAHGQKFLGQAPIVFAFLQDEERSRKKYGERGKLYSTQDGTIAASYLQLAAEELGLGSCWVGAFEEGKVADLLETSKRPLALIPVGYPARKPNKNSGRRELDDLVRFIE